MLARSAGCSMACPHRGHYAEDVLRINTMRILRLIKYTAGRMHGWYATDKGFSVRKPNASIGEIESEMEITLLSQTALVRETWWDKVWGFIMQLLRKWGILRL